MTQKMTGWIKWAALGCGAAVLVVAGIVAAVFFVVMKATSEPQEVVNSFLAAAARGDYETAHDHFAIPLKEAQPLEEFIVSVESNASLFRIVDTTFTSRSRDLQGVVFEGIARLEGGSEIPASFRLIQENDHWKLIAYDIGT